MIDETKNNQVEIIVRKKYERTMNYEREKNGFVEVIKLIIFEGGISISDEVNHVDSSFFY